MNLWTQPPSGSLDSSSFQMFAICQCKSYKSLFHMKNMKRVCTLLHNILDRCNFQRILHLLSLLALTNQLIYVYHLQSFWMHLWQLCQIYLYGIVYDFFAQTMLIFLMIFVIINHKNSPVGNFVYYLQQSYFVMAIIELLALSA